VSRLSRLVGSSHPMSVSAGYGQVFNACSNWKRRFGMDDQPREQLRPNEEGERGSLG
jgi:hypothetical protein